MRKHIFTFLIIFIYSYSTKGITSSEYLRIDSTYIYTWDTNNSEWFLSSVQLYHYDVNNNPILVIQYSPSSHAYLNKTEYVYNEQGLLSILTGFKWDGSWMPVNKYEYIYNELSQVSEILLKTWNIDHWENNRWQKNYKYDIDGNLIEFQMYYWRNNSWSLPTTDYSTFNKNGRITKRVAIYPNGRTDYQVLYFYNSYGLLTEYYAQSPSETGWNNWWLRKVEYNACGIKQTQIQYTGSGTDWIPSTKTVFFYSFNEPAYTGKKVPLCHNGHTIWVSKHAVPAHLKHGDCLGECVSEDRGRKHERDNHCIDQGKGNRKSLLLEENVLTEDGISIFPNPVQDQIHIDLGTNELHIRHINLMDLSGRIILQVPVNGTGILTLPRGDLQKGMYILRLRGDEVLNRKVILE